MGNDESMRVRGGPHVGRLRRQDDGVIRLQRVFLWEWPQLFGRGQL
jgi:hypothetical protein